MSLSVKVEFGLSSFNYKSANNFDTKNSNWILLNYILTQGADARIEQMQRRKKKKIFNIFFKKNLHFERKRKYER